MEFQNFQLDIKCHMYIVHDVSDLKIELRGILKIFLFIINFVSSAYQNSNLFYILQDSTSKNTLAWLKIVAVVLYFFSMAFEDFFLLDTLEW